MDSKPPPPALPPRQPVRNQDNHMGSPSDAADRPGTSPYQHGSGSDPRSSSTQSLPPADNNPQRERRKLFLIYIHGFMGNETSFQSFPAHVHNVLTSLVFETHVVHTKIYPRYRSKKHITFARDDFCRWLGPHMSPTTDIVLLGHSMGGFISAEVAMVTEDGRMKERILGTVGLDVPFLGMHPGVIKSGLASIFQPAPVFPVPPSQLTARSDDATNDQRTDSVTSDSGSAAMTPPLVSPFSGSSSSLPLDPNYNPAFTNDEKMPTRTLWGNVWHFVHKNSDNITRAATQLVTSHLEFGGAMANYGELQTRYARIRALEADSLDVRKSVLGDSVEWPPRVRFLNYYTACTGRPKPPKPEPEVEQAVRSETGDLTEALNQSAEKATGNGLDSSRVDQQSSDVLFSFDGEKSEGFDPSELDPEDESPATAMTHVDPQVMTDVDYDDGPDALLNRTSHLGLDETTTNGSNTIYTPSASSTGQLTPTTTETSAQMLTPSISATPSASLPPLPDLPPQPQEPDYAQYPDANIRKVIEKDHKRALKAYDKAIKDREKSAKDRAKLLEKRERQAKKDEAKREKEMLRAVQKTQQQQQQQQQQQGQTTTTSDSGVPIPDSESTKSSAPKKERNFCSLPPKDLAGNTDSCWRKVLIKDVDEVGAHCGLFFEGMQHYEALVGDLTALVQEWVQENESLKVLRGMQEDVD